MSRIRRTSITLVDWVDHVDLRKVVRRHADLASLAKKHKLEENGDTLVLVNSRVDRYRLVTMLGGVPMLVLPPTTTRAQERLGIFVRLHEFLRGLVFRTDDRWSAARCNAYAAVSAVLDERQERRRKVA